MMHAGHRAYKAADQWNRPGDLLDGGDRTELCREVWDAAKPRIYSGWQDGTWKALEELRTEELYGQTYSSSLGR